MVDADFFRNDEFSPQNFRAPDEALWRGNRFRNSDFAGKQPSDMEFFLSFIACVDCIFRYPVIVKGIPKVETRLDNFRHGHRIFKSLFRAALFKRRSFRSVNWIHNRISHCKVRRRKQNRREDLPENFWEIRI